MSVHESDRRCSTCRHRLVVVKGVTGCPVCDNAKQWPNVKRGGAA